MGDSAGESTAAVASPAPTSPFEDHESLVQQLLAGKIEVQQELYAITHQTTKEIGRLETLCAKLTKDNRSLNQQNRDLRTLCEGLRDALSHVNTDEQILSEKVDAQKLYYDLKHKNDHLLRDHRDAETLIGGLREALSNETEEHAHAEVLIDQLSRKDAQSQFTLASQAEMLSSLQRTIENNAIAKQTLLEQLIEHQRDQERLTRENRRLIDKIEAFNLVLAEKEAMRLQMNNLLRMVGDLEDVNDSLKKSVAKLTPASDEREYLAAQLKQSMTHAALGDTQVEQLQQQLGHARGLNDGRNLPLVLRELVPGKGFHIQGVRSLRDKRDLLRMALGMRRVSDDIVLRVLLHLRESMSARLFFEIIGENDFREAKRMYVGYLRSIRDLQELIELHAFFREFQEEGIARLQVALSIADLRDRHAALLVVLEFCKTHEGFSHDTVKLVTQAVEELRKVLPMDFVEMLDGELEMPTLPRSSGRGRDLGNALGNVIREIFDFND